jgi:hypothetical protein
MIAVDDGITNGNLNWADVLFLIAAILFFVEALLRASAKPEPTRGVLVPLGLTLIAIAWLLL